MVLGKWPTWRTILFYVFISILYMFWATSCSLSGESIVSIQYLIYVTMCRWPFGVQVGKFLSDPHTKRSPTHSNIYQMLYWYNWFLWWWARGCSKNVENWNKYIENNYPSSWSFTKNHNKMHGQQNIKIRNSCSMGRYVNPEPPEYDTLVFIMWLLWPSTKYLILSLFLSSTGKAIARFPKNINPNPDFIGLSEKVTYC